MDENKSNETIKKYNKINTLLQNRNITITDYNATIKYIETNGFSISYNKLIVSAIVYKLKLDKYNNDELLNQYYGIIKNLSKQVKNKIDNHEVKQKIPSWSSIIQIRENYKNIYRGVGDKNNLIKHQAIIALYTFIPPRRIRDYSLMKYVIDENKTTDKDYNYYIADADKLVFNEYKTKSTFAQQEVIIPSLLKTALTNYISDRKIKSGESLFNLSDSGFDSIVIRIFGGGVDMIRRSYVDHVFKDNNLPTNAQMKSISNQMSHSLETHLSYRTNSIKNKISSGD